MAKSKKASKDGAKPGFWRRFFGWFNFRKRRQEKKALLAQTETAAEFDNQEEVLPAVEEAVSVADHEAADTSPPVAEAAAAAKQPAVALPEVEEQPEEPTPPAEEIAAVAEPEAPTAMAEEVAVEEPPVADAVPVAPEEPAEAAPVLAEAEAAAPETEPEAEEKAPVDEIPENLEEAAPAADESKDDKIALLLTAMQQAKSAYLAQKAQAEETARKLELAGHLYESYQKAAHSDSPKERSEAYHFLEAAAELGLATAQSQLGRLLLAKHNPLAPNDEERGLHWVMSAVAQEDALGYLCLGDLYAQGMRRLNPSNKRYEVVIPRDDETAYEQYEKAATLGLVEAQEIMARRARNLKDIPKAIYWYDRAASQGRVISQKALAALYESEPGFKDLEMALYWYDQVLKNKNLTMPNDHYFVKKKIQAIQEQLKSNASNIEKE